MSGPGRRTLKEALERIEAARSESRSGVPPEGRITLSHGSGGKATHDLIEGLLGPAFSNPILDERGDAGVFEVGDPAGLRGEPTGRNPAAGRSPRLAFTTDTFVVTPPFFPGGDIGRVAVNGTVNDLAVSGADPLHLSVALILEEGFPLEELQRVLASMRTAADRAGVTVATGDTKVVEKGHGDGIYVNTSGVGRVRPDAALSPSGARPGDHVLVSGPLGAHGVAVMIARRRLELEGEIRSDTAPLHGLTSRLLDAVGPSVRCLRDATRGGLASALNELAERSGVAVAVDEERVPVRRPVRAACEILGIDPLHMANEGTLVAVVAPEDAGEALAVMREDPLGGDAALVGRVHEEPRSVVYVRTELGGRRVLDMLVGDALPRIC